MKALLMVFLGGGLGSICRYGISIWFHENHLGFPTKTFLANLISCMILGLMMGLILRHEVDDKIKLFIMAGFCGGFSTFSTFSGEVFSLIEANQYAIAFAYVACSVIICTIVLFGMYLLGQNI